MNDDDMDLIINTGSSIEESKGVTMHLEGDLFIPMIIGVMGSMFLIGFLIMVSGIPIVISFATGILPAVLVGIYIAVFKNNKPPNYQEDLIGLWLGSECTDANPVQPRSSYRGRG
jgi:hypothetical protein